MKKILIVAALSLPLSAVADEIDVLQEVQTQSTDSCAMDAIAEECTSSPSLLGAEEPAYYRTWLGEKCIDFGTSKPYYNWKRDVSYAGLPLFFSSFIIKDKKKAFRSARFDFESHFKTSIDNYTQFAPYMLAGGLKLAGVKGRSDWPRFVVSTILSNAVMATAVNATKYSVKEMRPDNSTRNSFPSGHTATAFVAATVLHKEYGLTRSPWYSVGGYAVATATGVMRVLNNRHWISDVMAGAGIGIMSTELGYFIGDIMMGNRGIQHLESDNIRNMEHPSFFDVQMGVGLRPGKIEFEYAEQDIPNDFIDLGTSTSFGVEGAYFFNRYLGVGGMLRITTTPGKGLNLTEKNKDEIMDINNALSKYTYIDSQGKEQQLPGIYNIYIEDNNFTDSSLDVGVYGNLPLGKYFSLGMKLLAGARLSDGIRYKARNGNPMLAEYMLSHPNGAQIPIYWFVDGEGNEFMSNDILMPGVTQNYNFVLDNETEEYDIMRVQGNNSFNYVAGISATWHYKSNFAWKVFLDFDSAKNKYTYTGNYFSDETKKIISESAFMDRYSDLWNNINRTVTGHASKFMNFLTLGGSFSVSF